MSTSHIDYKDIAPGAAGDAAITATQATSDSTVTDLSAEENEAPRMATLEQNRWKLDGTFTLQPQPVPFWSANLSSENCVLSPAPVIDITFDEQYSSVGLTLIFDTTAGDYCSKVNVKWYQGTTLKADVDFSPDDTTYYCEYTVTSYDRIVLTLLETSLPYRRARLNQIIFGAHRRFYMDELRNVKITNETDISSLKFPISTLTFTLDSRTDVHFLFQLKQPIEAWNNGRLIGVYYIDSYSRSAANLYDLDCYDAVGVLSESSFAGGVYTGYSAQELVSDIIGEDFELVFEAADRTLTGIIQPSTKRDALRQVLFAWGVAASTDGRHGLRFFKLPETGEIVTEDRVYAGASVETSSVITEVQVTAHTYTPANNGSIEINGEKYTDVKQLFSVKNPDVTANDKANLIEVTNATLISPDIGAEVARRVYDYYMRRDTAKTKVVWKGEHLGDRLTLPTPWGNTVTGNMTKANIVLSNTVAASLETLG